MAKNVTINTSQLNIPWQPNTSYRLALSEGFVVDASGSRTPSPAVDNLRTITTNTVPTVVASYPSNGDTDTDNFYSISLSFSRTIKKGTTGTIRLYDDSDTLIVSYNITDSEVSVVGNNLIIDVDGYIQQLTSYYLLIDNTCILDLDNFAFAGYTTDTDFTYTTAGTSLQPYTLQRTLSNVQINDINNTYFLGNGVIYNASTGSLIRSQGGDKLSDTLVMSVTTGFDNTTGKYGNAYIYSASDGNLLYRIGNPNVSGNSTLADSFGFSDGSDLNDSYAVVAALNETNPEPIQDGIVYVFSMNTGGLFSYFEQPENLQQYNFGRSVSISGNNIAVGAPGTSFTDLSGRVYIFDIYGVLQTTLNNPDADNSPTNPFVDFDSTGGISSLRYDRFGHEVCYRGQWLAVSAPGEGKIYVYANNVYSRTISVPFYFTSDELTNQLKYGSNLYPDIYGNYLVVTRLVDSVFEDPNVTSKSRQVKVLIYDLSTGVLVQEITYTADGTDYFRQGSIAKITENYLSITLLRISGPTTYIYNK
jgi:hypothetical protein